MYSMYIGKTEIYHQILGYDIFTQPHIRPYPLYPGHIVAQLHRGSQESICRHRVIHSDDIESETWRGNSRHISTCRGWWPTKEITEEIEGIPMFGGGFSLVWQEGGSSTRSLLERFFYSRNWDRICFEKHINYQSEAIPTYKLVYKAIIHGFITIMSIVISSYPPSQPFRSYS